MSPAAADRQPRRWPLLTTCYGVAALLGAAAVWLPDRASATLVSAFICSASLWWQWRDAQRRRLASGAWIPALFILCHPLGVLLWMLRSRGARGFPAFLLYVLAFVGFEVAMLGGLVATVLLANPRRLPF